MNRRARSRRRTLVGLLLAVGLTVGLLPAGAVGAVGTAGDAAHTVPPAPHVDAATRRALGDLAPFAAPSSGDDRVHAAATSLSQPDPTGDATARSDVTKTGARLTGHSLRLSVTVPGMANPATDPGWNDVLKSHVVWGIDAGGDGTWDRLVYLLAIDGGIDAWVTANNAANQVPLCSGNATYETGGNLAVQVPSACVGSPSQLTWGVVFRYQWTASTPTREDSAPNGDDGAGPITSATTSASNGGAVVLDNVGALYRANVGGLPSSGLWSEYASVGNARGLAVTPDGGHGYVLAASGRIFGISFARNNLPPRVYGAKSWPGQNVARGIAIRPNGGAGFVVDGFGNLYPFGIGAKKAVPTLVGVPKWPGVDMARGVAVMPNGKGGFTLDAFGGLHWFSIGSGTPAPAILGGPSFPGNDAARGVSILPDGTGGFVIDKNGGLHFFSIGTTRTSPGAGGGPAFPGDNARGVGVLTRLVARP
jgi:hypothetical protein